MLWRLYQSLILAHLFFALGTIQANGVENQSKTVSLLDRSLNVVLVLDDGSGPIGDLISATLGTALKDDQIVVTTIPVVNNLLSSYFLPDTQANKAVKELVSDITKRLKGKGGETKNLVILFDQKDDPNYVILVPEYKFPSGKATKQSLRALGLSPNLHQLSYQDCVNTYLDVVDIGSLDITALLKIFPYSLVHKRFFIIGHGTSKFHEDSQTIAMLKPEEFRKILRYFALINTDIVGYLSCFAGGTNLEDIYKEFDEKLNKIVGFVLPYPIFVASLTETQVIWPKITFKDFFKQVDSFFEGKIANFSQAFNPMLEALQLDVSGHPSIRLPGTNFFQAVDLDALVTLITFDKVLKYNKGEGSFYENNPAFVLPETDQALLLYPSLVGIPIVIEGRKAPSIVSMIRGNSRHYLERIVAENMTLKELLGGIDFPTPILGHRFFFIKELKVSSLFEGDYLDNKSKSFMIDIKDPDKALIVKQEPITLHNLALVYQGTDVSKLTVMGQLSQNKFFSATFVNRELMSWSTNISVDEYLMGVVLGLKIGQPTDDSLRIATGGNEQNQFFIKALVNGLGAETELGERFKTLLNDIEEKANKPFDKINAQKLSKILQSFMKQPVVKQDVVQDISTHEKMNDTKGDEGPTIEFLDDE